MRLLTQTTAALALRVAGAGSTALAFVIVARALPLDQVGVFALVSSFVLVGRYLGPLGYDQLAIRRFSHMDAVEGVYSAERFIVRRVLFATAVGATCVAVASIAVWALGYSIPIWPIVAALLVYAASALSGVLSGVLRARGALLDSIFGDAFAAPVGTLSVILLLQVNARLASDSACGAVVLGAVVGALWQFFQAKRKWRCPYELGKWSEHLSVNHAIRLWRVQAVNYGQSRFLLFAATFVGGAALAATVEAAFKVALIPTLGTWAIGSVVGPKLANRTSAREIDGGAALLAFAGLAGVTGTMLYLGFFALFGFEVLRQFVGANFIPAYYPALVMLLGVSINALAGNFATYMLYNGMDGIVFQYTLVAFLIGVVCALAVGPFLGGIGIAGSLVLGSCIRDLGLALHLERKSKMLTRTVGQLVRGGLLRVLAA